MEEEEASGANSQLANSQHNMHKTVLSCQLYIDGDRIEITTLKLRHAQLLLVEVIDSTEKGKKM